MIVRTMIGTSIELRRLSQRAARRGIASLPGFFLRVGSWGEPPFERFGRRSFEHNGDENGTACHRLVAMDDG